MATAAELRVRANALTAEVEATQTLESRAAEAVSAAEQAESDEKAARLAANDELYEATQAYLPLQETVIKSVQTFLRDYRTVVAARKRLELAFSRASHIDAVPAGYVKPPRIAVRAHDERELADLPIVLRSITIGDV